MYDILQSKVLTIWYFQRISQSTHPFSAEIGHPELWYPVLSPALESGIWQAAGGGGGQGDVAGVSGQGWVGFGQRWVLGWMRSVMHRRLGCAGRRRVGFLDGRSARRTRRAFGCVQRGGRGHSLLQILSQLAHDVHR